MVMMNGVKLDIYNNYIDGTHYKSSWISPNFQRVT
jgi:hypothetical protein